MGSQGNHPSLSCRPYDALLQTVAWETTIKGLVMFVGVAVQHPGSWLAYPVPQWGGGPESCFSHPVLPSLLKAISVPVPSTKQILLIPNLAHTPPTFMTPSSSSSSSFLITNESN